MKIDLEQIKDCDHCFHTFGSFGCCTTVSNKWVYFCREGQRKYLVGRVLDLIDTSQTYKMTSGDTDTYIDKRVLREAVEALKGEQK